MESAFQAALPVLPVEEEPQESSVGGISHQVGLRSMGPALAGEVSSYHPPDEEGGDETEMGDAESVPAAVPGDQVPMRDPVGAREELIGGSASSLALLHIPAASGASPTTGLFPQPVASDSQEKVDYEASEEDEGDEEEGLDGDDEDDEIEEAWDTLPMSSPDKVSSYIPVSLSGSPTAVVTPVLDQPETAASCSDQQLIEIPTVTTPSPPKSAPLIISLRPTLGTSLPSLPPAGAFAIHPSSPSTLGVTVLSAASSPASSMAITPLPAISVATSSSPATILSPASIPGFLEMLVRQFEQVMQQAVTAVRVGQYSFEAFKPFLLNCMNNIEQVGDVECTRRCSENISRLERDLKALQDLICMDVEARIEAAFVGARSRAMLQYEVLRKSLIEREARVASSKTQCDQWQAELASMNNTLHATRETLARIQAELAQQEANVKDLTQKSAEAYTEYCQEAQALEEARREVELAAPDEEEIKKGAAAVVRAARDREIAEIEARLASITRGNH